MKRALLSLFLLMCAAPIHGAPALSLRPIGGVDVGFVLDNGFSISPDGRYLSVLSAPGEKGSDCTLIERKTHKFWNVPGAFRMKPLTFARAGHGLWIWGLSADKSLPGAPRVREDEAFIALYDPARRRYRFALRGDVEDWDVPSESTLSRDGRSLIFSSQDGWVRGFSTRTGRQKWKKRAIDKGDVPVNLALSPDGTRALRFPDDEGEFQTTQIIEARSGRVIQTLKLPLKGDAISAFQSGKFAPRGNMVAVFKPDDQSWAFFDTISGRFRWKLGQSSQNGENDLSWVWSPDARRIAVSGPHGFELRDAQNGRVLSSSANFADLENRDFDPDSMIFSPDGQLIYALAANRTGFGAETVLWQIRVEGTPRQRRADAFWLAKTRAAQQKFALSPRHIDQSLILAAREGDAERVAFLLDRGANIEARDGRGETALVNAGNATDAVQLLLERGANFKPYGDRLLATAAAEGNATLTRLFLQRGVKADADASGYGSPTALLAALEFGKIATVRLLLDAGADVNARGNGGFTPLLALVNSNFAGKAVVPLTQLLLERGADPNIANADGQTPLMIVAQWNDLVRVVLPAQMLRDQQQIIHLLLAHNANPDARDKKGQTASSLAVSPALKTLLNTSK